MHSTWSESWIDYFKEIQHSRPRTYEGLLSCGMQQQQMASCQRAGVRRLIGTDDASHFDCCSWKLQDFRWPSAVISAALSYIDIRTVRPFSVAASDYNGRHCVGCASKLALIQHKARVWFQEWLPFLSAITGIASVNEATAHLSLSVFVMPHQNLRPPIDLLSAAAK